MSTIHPLACVDAKAELGRDVNVGPFAYIGPGVRVGDGCVVHHHASLLGPAEFGPANVFFPQCVVGGAPQDLKYKGGPTRLVTGRDNVFRESVTVHRGTEVDRGSQGETRIGDNNLLMVGAHIAHDVHLGDNIILANNVLIAGHVKIEDRVNVGGGSAMHHFVTVGKYAYVGGMTRVTHDVPPFMKVLGYDQEVRGANGEGMRRWKIPDGSIAAVRRAWKLMYARHGVVLGIREIEANGLIDDPHVRYLVAFLKRKLEFGVFGRVREHFREDADSDRESFYSAKS
ncbi:Acyl-[acyl-carrier-protein]--UDP-N-acetylglucosamine O-acyltransferase [Phycisphaerae bacterium RAS1]|nr:Acyl-[acyl-carrier-protein]--UDP-N-acetylglucosamine O-acyltransferase [Phycisphaerae bacterium RAS1]